MRSNGKFKIISIDEKDKVPEDVPLKRLNERGSSAFEALNRFVRQKPIRRLPARDNFLISLASASVGGSCGVAFKY